MSPTVVGIVIISNIIVILIWDWWLYHDGVERNSISQVTIDASNRNRFVSAIIGFLMGLLFGHLFA